MASDHHTGPAVRNRGLETRNYTAEEAEFLRAMQRYRESSRRPFPGPAEALRVAVSLGYRRVAQPGPLPVYEPGLDRRRNHSTLPTTGDTHGQEEP